MQQTRKSCKNHKRDAHESMVDKDFKLEKVNENMERQIQD